MTNKNVVKFVIQGVDESEENPGNHRGITIHNGKPLWIRLLDGTKERFEASNQSLEIAATKREYPDENGCFWAEVNPDNEIDDHEIETESESDTVINDIDTPSEVAVSEELKPVESEQVTGVEETVPDQKDEPWPTQIIGPKQEIVTDNDIIVEKPKKEQTTQKEAAKVVLDDENGEKFIFDDMEMKVGSELKGPEEELDEDLHMIYVNGEYLTEDEYNKTLNVEYQLENDQLAGEDHSIEFDIKNKKIRIPKKVNSSLKMISEMSDLNPRDIKDKDLDENSEDYVNFLNEYKYRSVNVAGSFKKLAVPFTGSG